MAGDAGPKTTHSVVSTGFARLRRAEPARALHRRANFCRTIFPLYMIQQLSSQHPSTAEIKFALLIYNNYYSIPRLQITSPGAWLDVSVRNLCSPLAKAFIDVRVLYPQAKANCHEEEKKQGYLPAPTSNAGGEGTFNPAVSSI